MKAFLMYEGRDFDLQRPLPANGEALTLDLGLNTLFAAMAGGDTFLFDVAKEAVLSSLHSSEEISYRQQVLADCLAQPSAVREVYSTAAEAIEVERTVWMYLRYSPDTLLARSIQVLELFVVMLKKLRRLADEHSGSFRSEGFVRLFAMLQRELDDRYFQTVDSHLRELRFRSGTLMSAELGPGNKGSRYLLRRPHAPSWRQRIPVGARSGYSFQIADRDDDGFRALSALRGRGLSPLANALAQAADHILSFFCMLRAELAFYVGCLNLREQLVAKGEPICLPVVATSDFPALEARGLYDASLTLHLATRAVGNDLAADDKSLVMITGANQGGKSTLLRSVGIAQLMMQCGMFVAAESFRANLCPGVFTHFKREEDASMKSGKLDEELSRMSDIADGITPGCLLLCNESFSSTNEREGSEIARQVVRALVEEGIRVFFVTHLYDLARGFYREGRDTALFLRAERQADGARTFKVVEGEPLSTSYGEDLYRRIFVATD
jgi:hypothetical protein